MFTFIVIAQAFNRSANIYNTLAASAFLLLLMDPFLIMNVGFQLSYLAVVGIVAIHPKLYNNIVFDNKLWDKIWAMISVSITAQLATFPLCLYYFHQFPNYFLLANIVAIPLSTIIIYFGISLFILFKVPLLSSVIATIFNYSLLLLNQFIFKMEHLPYASFSGIFISILETCLIYSIIVFVYFYFIKAKFNYLFIGFSILILFFSIQVIEQQNQHVQKKLIVYNISKTSAIDFVSGTNNILVTDSFFVKNEKAAIFHIKNSWDNFGIRQTKIMNGNFKTQNLFVNGNYMQFYNKWIIHLKEKIIFIKFRY